MNVLRKKRLPLWILFFMWCVLGRAEAEEENFYHTEFSVWVKEDFIKVKMVFPNGTIPDSTLYKIYNPDLDGVSVRIKNDHIEYLEPFYQLVDVEVHAVPSQNEAGVVFEVIEHLERMPLNSEVIRDTYTNSTKYFVQTDKQVNFRNDMIPYLTFSGNSHDIKYLRFYTKY